MKKYLKIISIVCCVIVCFTAFSACGKLSEEELSAVGKYDLTAIQGNTQISVNDFEYNYIILDNKGNFEMKNKAAGAEYASKGKWSLNGETLTMKMSGLFTKKENHQLKDNKIYISGELLEKEITLVYTKVSE